MEIALALGSALAYGVADFTGGVLSKRAHVFTVILASQLVSCAVLILAVPLWSGAFSARALEWGAASGVAGMAGAALLYRGLAIGRMGVVAPITAVLAAAIPVAFGLAVGERPGATALLGVVVGFAAVVLISRTPEPRSTEAALQEASSGSLRWGNTGVLEALGAGACFGLFFILLERTPQDSGLWPLVGMRVAMVALVSLLIAVSGASLRPEAGMTLGLMWLGFTGLGADLLYLLATREGLLSLVAVITSLYPAGTVALARALLKERMVHQQLAGVACAALSVTLIALG